MAVKSLLSAYTWNPKIAFLKIQFVLLKQDEYNIVFGHSIKF